MLATTKSAAVRDPMERGGALAADGGLLAGDIKEAMTLSS
jgi:hypothetical protein